MTLHAEVTYLYLSMTHCVYNKRNIVLTYDYVQSSIKSIQILMRTTLSNSYFE